MDESIIILSSDDEDSKNQKSEAKGEPESSIPISPKRSIESVNGSSEMSPPSKIRRVQPTKIGEVAKDDKRSSDANQNNGQTTSEQHSTQESIVELIEKCTNDETEAGPSKEEMKKENEITKELKGFIKACKTAESNDDMKKIIKNKLLKYYHLVHPTYVLSKFFRKMLEDTALAVLKDPRSVYMKLQEIISELKSRKKTNTLPPEVNEVESTVPEPTETSIEVKGTGDEKKDLKLKKLNRGLTKLKEAIEALEEEEVNWDYDEDSAYIRKVRYEKRAIEIYKKICEITGESTHAHRIVKQPVTFKSTKYKEFNKKLTKKINRENGFPSYYDVYRLLDFCNKEYKYDLYKEEMRRIAESAFLEVGKVLKERRTNDLYESAMHWAGKTKDPAKEDVDLKSKLEKNREIYRKKTEDLMELFVRKQLNGDTGCSDDEEKEIDESQAGTSKDSIAVKQENDVPKELDTDLKLLPTKKIVETIDVKTEKVVSEDDCDMMNGEHSLKDEKQLDSNADLPLSL